ncbi:hypothetical protein IPV09_13990, partial [Tessaracoccus sp. SD287]|uniref:hypothetical protein n=1 Tax=Tessaracoccus sp. SD287 TaxID=2782008 RepID=UPI001A959071
MTVIGAAADSRVVSGRGSAPAEVAPSDAASAIVANAPLVGGRIVPSVMTVEARVRDDLTAVATPALVEGVDPAARGRIARAQSATRVVGLVTDSRTAAVAPPTASPSVLIHVPRVVGGAVTLGVMIAPVDSVVATVVVVMIVRVVSVAARVVVVMIVRVVSVAATVVVVMIVLVVSVAARVVVVMIVLVVSVAARVVVVMIVRVVSVAATVVVVMSVLVVSVVGTAVVVMIG